MPKTEQKLLKELRAAAQAWQSNLHRIGQILNDLADAGHSPDLYRKGVLKGEFGIPLASTAVAMRWAAGDYGTADQVAQLLGKVRHSILAHMPAAAAKSVLAGKHRIHSRHEHRVVLKSFAEMTPEEVADNISPQGFRPIAARIKAEPVYSTFPAADVVIADRGAGVVFISKGRRSVRVTVSTALLRKALALLPADPATAVA